MDVKRRIYKGKGVILTIKTKIIIYGTCRERRKISDITSYYAGKNPRKEIHRKEIHRKEKELMTEEPQGVVWI